MISQNEVRFGVVPGLAGLAEKLSNAFAHRKASEADMKLAELKFGYDRRNQEARGLAEQQSQAAKAEEDRRAGISKTLGEADKLRKQQVSTQPMMGDGTSYKESDLLKYPNLESADPAQKKKALASLATRQYMGELFDTAAKTGNVPQAQLLQRAGQMLDAGVISEDDLRLKLGDDAPLLENFGFNAREGQKELMTQSKAVANRIDGADLSYLPPAEQEAAKAKSEGLNSAQNPNTFSPQDITGQMGQLAILGEARQTNSIKASDFISQQTGAEYSVQERNVINKTFHDLIDVPLLNEYPENTGDADEDRENEYDRQLAMGITRQRTAEIMRTENLGFFDALNKADEGKNYGTTARNAVMASEVDTPMTPANTTAYNRNRAAMEKNTSFTPRQKDAFAQMKTAVPSVPDSVVSTLVRSQSMGIFDAAVDQLGGGGKYKKLSALDQQKLTELYRINSLSTAKAPTTFGQEQVNLLLASAYPEPAPAPAPPSLQDNATVLGSYADTVNQGGQPTAEQVAGRDAVFERAKNKWIGAAR